MSFFKSEIIYTNMASTRYMGLRLVSFQKHTDYCVTTNLNMHSLHNTSTCFTTGFESKYCNEIYKPLCHSAIMV